MRAARTIALQSSRCRPGSGAAVTSAPRPGHAQTLPWIIALAAVALLRRRCRSWCARTRAPQAAAAAHRMDPVAEAGVQHRRAARVSAAARGAAAPCRAVQAAAGSLLPAHRAERGALLVRPARRDPRHLRHLQRQRPRARGDRPRHRPRQLAARAADQAVRARRLPRALPALPGGQPAVGGGAAVAGAAKRAVVARPAAGTEHRRTRRATRCRSTAPQRRRERTALWQDSSFFQDSFFGADNRSIAAQTASLADRQQPARGVSVREARATTPDGACAERRRDRRSTRRPRTRPRATELRRRRA